MKKVIKYLDKPLLILSILLFILGAIMVFSSSNVTAYMSHEVSPYYYFIKQGIFLLIGFVLAIIMLFFNTKSYGVISKILMIVFTASLVALLLYSEAKNKAISWFDFGLFSIQPSEFIKIISIVWLSYYYEKNKQKLNVYTKSLFPIGICAIVAILIFAQPDLGTMIIFVLIVGTIFLSVPIAKNIKIKTISIAIGSCIFAVLVVLATGKNLLQERQVQRFNFTKPCDKLLTTGNQVCNCYIAINNGGLTGVGLGNSTQKYLYLPEAYTDFIFAIIVEELGIITGVLIIIAYIIILYRILLIGRNSPTNRGATMCYGVAVYIFLHIAINLLGILGLMPMTGVPLPFMSYGGSFTICLIAALTIVQRVNIENKIFNEKNV